MTTTETTITPIDRAEIVNGNVVVAYDATEATLAELRQRFENVVFDLSTTKGDKEARAARQDLVKLRTGLEERRKQFKAPALALGRKIDAEAERITGEIKAVENPIDLQIKADEQRKAAEKAERDRIEAERVEGHQKRLATIRACAAKAQDLPSERIANGITQVEAIDLSPAVWQEFVDAAVAAMAETLTTMRAAFAAAKAREDEAARLEAQRLENERIAEENRALAARLAEQQRELAAKAAALAAQEAASAPAETPRPAPSAEENQPDPGDSAQPQAAPELQAEQPAATLAEVFLPEEEDPPCEVPTLKLGEIHARLRFPVTADLLAQFGFRAEVEGSAKRYRASEFPAICDALCEHIYGVRDQYAHEASTALA